ncbi:MAG: hypothetical protein SCALA702_21940 [Melioribacteraceae bacterium]|nr:MAG: hypothetical protein SCALA702_21940 [Melioribacteraceae bacterium]
MTIYSVKNMPRTPEQNKEIREKTRRSIMDNALKLFATKGFHGTSMADVAKEAGVSKGLAYNYFKSKDDIAHSIINEIMVVGDQIVMMMQKIDDPVEQLHTMINYTFGFLDENEQYWRLYISFVLQPEVANMSSEIMLKFAKNMFHALEDIFTRIGIKNVKEEARYIGALIDGITLHYYFDKENYPLKSVLKLLHSKYSREALEMLK